MTTARAILAIAGKSLFKASAATSGTAGTLSSPKSRLAVLHGGGQDVDVVRVPELLLGSAPERRGRVGRDEADEADREREHVDGGGERRAADVPQGYGDVVCEHDGTFRARATSWSWWS